MRHFGIKAVSYLQRQNKCHYASCFTRLQNAKEGKSGYSWLHLQLARAAKLDWNLGKVCHDLLHAAPVSQQLPFWRPSMVKTSSHHKPSLQALIQQELLLRRRGQKASSSGSTLHWEQENRADLVKVLAKTWAAGLSSGGGARGHMAVLDRALLGTVSRTMSRAACRTETCWSWVYF